MRKFQNPAAKTMASYLHPSRVLMPFFQNEENIFSETSTNKLTLRNFFKYNPWEKEPTKNAYVERIRLSVKFLHLAVTEVRFGLLGLVSNEKFQNCLSDCQGSLFHNNSTMQIFLSGVRYFFFFDKQNLKEKVISHFGQTVIGKHLSLCSI